MDIIKIHYSVEPRERRCVKDYGFLSFTKNIGKNISSKYSQKLVDSTSKRAIHKTAEATGDLMAIKLPIRLQVFQRSCTQKNLQRNSIQKSRTQKNYHQMKVIMKYQKKDLYPHKKRQQVIDELRLI